MSEYIRGSKKPAASFAHSRKNDQKLKPGAVRATIKSSPGGLTIASVSLASVMLASGAQAQDAGSLPEINVQGTQGTGYQATSSSLTRVPTPLRDTPQTVNVVTEQVIREQAASTARDALRNVAGVTFRAGEGGNQGDTPYIRGFSAQNDVYRDGARDPGWYTRDIFATEAVEVYKGPSSVLFGRGSTGGVINLTTKTAVDRNFQEYTVTGTSGPGGRTTADINQKLNDQASARIVMMGQRYDIAGRDHVEENRLGFAPSLKLTPNDRTKITFSYIYQYENSVPDYGVPFLPQSWGFPRSPAPVARNTWYGILSDPYKDVQRDDIHIATAKVEHEITNSIKITNTSRYMYVNHFQRNVFPEPNLNVPPPPNLNTNWVTGAPNRAQVATINTFATNQTDVLMKFATGAWQHTATTGLDVSQETRDFLRNQFSGQANTNFLNPDPYRAGGTPGAPTASQQTFGWGNNIGVYIADQIKLNQWFEILGSVRFDSFRFRQNAPLAPASVQNLDHTDNVLSHRYGAVFHPTPNSSVYVMRGTSFNPTADTLSIGVTNATTAASQAALGPEKNETTEGGVKVDVLDGKLSLASAVFLTEKTNFRVMNPDNTTTALDGKIRATGAEASVTGYITKQWQIILTYTYVHARVVKTTIPQQLGAEPTNTPTNAFSLWTTYDATDKLQVGFGAFYTGEVYGDIPTATTAGSSQSGLVPEYWRFDAMAAYKFTDKTTLQFNVYNLTDKYYYASAYSNWAVPGASRTFALTLRHRI